MNWPVGKKKIIKVEAIVTKVDPNDKRLGHYVRLKIGSVHFDQWVFPNEVKAIFGEFPKKKVAPKKKAAKKAREK